MKKKNKGLFITFEGEEGAEGEEGGEGEDDASGDKEKSDTGDVDKKNDKGGTDS